MWMHDELLQNKYDVTYSKLLFEKVILKKNF